MAKAKGPNDVRVNIPQQKTLNEKEAESVKQRRGQKISPTDLQRIYSGAGVERKKRKKGLQMPAGDDLPYALPKDEVDPDAMDRETLEGARGSLSLVSSQLGEFSAVHAEAESLGAAGEISLASVVVGGTFLPGEDNDALQELADRAPEHEIPDLAEMQASISRATGMDISGVEVGPQVIAAGLVVAGRTPQVEVEEDAEGKKTLHEGKMAQGVQEVTQQGQKAVETGERLFKGVEREVGFNQTTFRR